MTYQESLSLFVIHSNTMCYIGLIKTIPDYTVLVNVLIALGWGWGWGGGKTTVMSACTAGSCQEYNLATVYNNLITPTAGEGNEHKLTKSPL